MERYHRIRRIGICLIMWAAILRFANGAALRELADFLSQPSRLSFLIYLQTGMDTRSCFLQSELEESEEEPTALPTQAPTVPPVLPLPEAVTAPAEKNLALPDIKSLEVTVNCQVSPDFGTLYAKPLPWNSRPKVLLYSTHSTESYTPGQEPYTPSGEYRTLNKEQNMLSVGAYLKEQLEALGIEVIADPSIHDSPSYNGAYTHARKGITKLLQENPDVDMVLDLHRDAVQTKSGQLRTAVEGRPGCAKIMLVVGTDASGRSHPHWQENLSVALKLDGILEALQPGITRPLTLRAQRFNQDLASGALLAEIGAAGNTRQEALQAAKVLAQAVAVMAQQRFSIAMPTEGE